MIDLEKRPNTEQEWLGIVEEWKSSNMSMKNWCQQNNFSYYQFRYWKRKILRKKQRYHQNNDKFIELTDDSPRQDQLILNIAGVSIHLENGFSPELLHKAIKVLKEMSC